MFSLACNLTKKDVEFLPVEILSKKVHASKTDFSIIKIISKNVSENNVDFSTIKITSKKSTQKQRECFDQRNYTKKSTWKKRGFVGQRNYTEKKIRGNDVEFSISKITSKKYVEMTWKFVKFGIRRIDVISTWNRRRFDMVCPLGLCFNSFCKVFFKSSFLINSFTV